MLVFLFGTFGGIKCVEAAVEKAHEPGFTADDTIPIRIFDGATQDGLSLICGFVEQFVITPRLLHPMSEGLPGSDGDGGIQGGWRCIKAWGYPMSIVDAPLAEVRADRADYCFGIANICKINADNHSAVHMEWAVNGADDDPWSMRDNKFFAGEFYGGVGSFRQMISGPPQRESEQGYEGRRYSSNGIPILISNVNDASRADSGTIDSRENEFWRIFFGLLTLCGGLFCLAGVKR
jgi:hypothetical protein